jgi:hypothetical protein
LFRRAIQSLRPKYRDLDFDTIERACTFLARPPATRQIDLAAGLRLKIEAARFIWPTGSSSSPK